MNVKINIFKMTTKVKNLSNLWIFWQLEIKYHTFMVKFPKFEIFFYHRYLILNVEHFVPLKLQTILCYSHFWCFNAIKCKHFYITKQCDFLHFQRIYQYKLDFEQLIWNLDHLYSYANKYDQMAKLPSVTKGQ